MTELMISRMQFGVSIGIHYLFPITTLGLTLFIVIFETLYLAKRQDQYRAISVFLVKLLSLVFVAGVATGLMMPFSIGANWARFSTYAGAVLGAIISVEAITAFALESAFISILLFGRERVSPFVYWVSAVLVFIGAHLSGFWIVAANSWLQTPAGYVLEDGRVVLTSLSQALFNPSTLIRFAHVVTAAWLVGAFVTAGIAAYYLARSRHQAFARKLLSIALPLALVLAVSQPILGHFHIMEVLENNPEKDAAYEGIFKSVNGAPLLLFGIPDEANQVIHFPVGAPYVLSLLESGDPMGRVRGLEEFPRETWPPVNVIFTTFHLMIVLGVVMIAVAALGVFLMWRNKLDAARWYLLLLPWLMPLPYLANELGWIGTEIGRQPWLIYGVMRTSDASTITLPLWQLSLSFTGILLVYTAITVVTFVSVRKLVRKGPQLG
ncbi:MAG: cytochrome ubiquinol oxidase subunit I [bacterium]